MATVDAELDQLRAVGHGVLALVDAAILLAIVAVILSKGSSAATLIRTFFQFLAWLVGQVIKPLAAVPALVLSNKLLPAGQYPNAAGGAGDSYQANTTATGGTGGTGGTVMTAYAVRDDNGNLASLSSTPTFAGQQPYTGSGAPGSAIPAGQ